MLKYNKKLYIGIAITLIFFSFTLIPSFRKESQISDSLIVPVEFTPSTFLYDALLQEKNKGKIDFSGKNYPGLGFFVTDIGTLHSGKGKNLIYYINSKEATVGVSSYALKDGDVIEWKLE